MEIRVHPESQRAREQLVDPEQFATAFDSDLHRLARRCLRRELAYDRLEPTELVNEAFLRLLRQDGTHWNDRSHVLAFAARTMRRVLVDRARSRKAAKRDPRRNQPTTEEGANRADPVEWIALNRAVIELSGLAPRQGQIVQLRYFLGLTLEEVAGALHVSPSTVKREWNDARLWLYSRLRPKESPRRRRRGRKPTKQRIT